VSRLFGRAAVLKCPWCGSRRTFLRGWFKRYDRCRTCGISWHREVGFELGTVTVNTILTFGTLTVAMVIGIVATLPDIPVFGLVASLCALGIVMPVAIYPFTYTIWLAFDLAVHPPERAELDEAMVAVASGAAELPPQLGRGSGSSSGPGSGPGPGSGSAQRRKRST
jgi:uncharacterized protein (DUF983 family)